MSDEGPHAESWRREPGLTGVQLIERERDRQQIAEGYSTGGDLVQYDSSEPLTSAAIVYAMTPEQRRQAGDPLGPVPWPWPWDRETFKPSANDRIKELAKAGALIAAALDYELAVKEGS